VQRQRQRERLAHGRVVVDDQDGSHLSSAHAAMDAAPDAKVAMTDGRRTPPPRITADFRGSGFSRDAPGARVAKAEASRLKSLLQKATAVA
jgi:hypothetical protein